MRLQNPELDHRTRCPSDPGIHLPEPVVLRSPGLLLAGIPIIIHILNRRRFKTVTWAAMEFLLRAMRKNRRRLRFEQWLLLATRCLVLLLLGMALARPMGCENGAMAALGRHTALNVFVIDNSYSMAYEANRPGAKTHLDQAKHIAKALLDQPSSRRRFRCGHHRRATRQSHHRQARL